VRGATSADVVEERVCSVRAPNSKTKRRRKTKIGANVHRNVRNRCANGATEIARLDIVGRSGKGGHCRTGLAAVDNDGRPTDWPNLASYRCCGSVGK